MTLRDLRSSKRRIRSRTFMVGRRSMSGRATNTSAASRSRSGREEFCEVPDDGLRTDRARHAAAQRAS